MCSSLPTLHQTSGDTHSFCVVYLGVKRAESTAHIVSEWLPLRTLRSQKTLFEEGVFTSIPCGAGPASAEAERRLCSWESQMDQIEGMKTGEPLSSSFPIRSSACSLRSEARPAVLPPGERAQCSACLFPRRGAVRTSMSFRKA